MLQFVPSSRTRTAVGRSGGFRQRARAHDVAGMFCYGMAAGWGSVSLPRAERTYEA